MFSPHQLPLPLQTIISVVQVQVAKVTPILSRSRNKNFPLSLLTLRRESSGEDEETVDSPLQPPLHQYVTRPVVQINFVPVNMQAPTLSVTTSAPGTPSVQETLALMFASTVLTHAMEMKSYSTNSVNVTQVPMNAGIPTAVCFFVSKNEGKAATTRRAELLYSTFGSENWGSVVCKSKRTR